MANNYSVYIYTTPNGKRYIGITCQKVKQRWNGGSGYVKCTAFYNAILKYGWNNIRHEVFITGLSEKSAKRVEAILIKRHKTQDRRYGYNMTTGGEGSTGRKVSKETRKKLSAIGKQLSEESRARLSAIQTGKRLSEETRAKISAVRAGSRHTDETKIKMSIAHQGFKHTEEAKAKMSKAADRYKKVVYQYTTDGELVNVWNSLSDAMNGLREGKPSTGINNCVAGRSKLAYGFYWTYEPIQEGVKVS
jgi:group I intron endonuclease